MRCAHTCDSETSAPTSAPSSPACLTCAPCRPCSALPALQACWMSTPPLGGPPARQRSTPSSQASRLNATPAQGGMLHPPRLAWQCANPCWAGRHLAAEEADSPEPSPWCTPLHACCLQHLEWLPRLPALPPSRLQGSDLVAPSSQHQTRPSPQRWPHHRPPLATAAAAGRGLALASTTTSSSSTSNSSSRWRTRPACRSLSPLRLPGSSMRQPWRRAWTSSSSSRRRR